MNKNAALLLFSMITALLLGCHGGEEDSGVTSVSPSSITSATCGALTQQIGAGVGQSFVADTLTVGLSPLSAGGSTSVTVNIVDCADNPYTPPLAVSFSSTCTGLGTAQIDSPIITNNGTAITTYVAQGCQGNDTIIATTVIDSADTDVSDLNLIAAGVVNVLPAAAGSIEFVSATPALISLKGTGGAGLTENSTVVFKVSDVSGGPVANRAVTFTLSTTIGGLSLSSSTGTTNASGQVQTVVQAGTIPTSVRVTATVSGSNPVIASQSDQLVVTTGLPDQDSFTIGVTKLNPEVWELIVCDPDTPQSENFVKVFLSDHFNNWVPDGTAVTFTAEGGQIESSCTTVNGFCSVQWCTTNPRPADGRVTILATALGVESFTDNNGNGMFDDGETFGDLDEAFRDDNENNTFNIGIDELFDFNVNGVFDTADNEYNGVLCNPSNTATPCSINKTLIVSAEIEVILASSNQNIAVADDDPAVGAGGTMDGSYNINLTAGSMGLVVSVYDDRFQLPPAGTTVAISTTNGTILGPITYTVPNTNSDGAFTKIFVILPDGTASSGNYTVTVTTPKSFVKTFSAAVQD